MSGGDRLILASHDSGLLNHWKKALGSTKAPCVSQFSELFNLEFSPESTVWIDSDLPGLPAWGNATWNDLQRKCRVICASSHPQNAAAIEALDAGCSAFCHAFADFKTLRQVQQTVLSGQVWVGRELMQQLLAGANRAKSILVARGEVTLLWADQLTQREKEIAILAANGASNKAIADSCAITERTVKAHLASIFTKLGLADRLQLALKVHGIK